MLTPMLAAPPVNNATHRTGVRISHILCPLASPLREPSINTHLTPPHIPTYSHTTDDARLAAASEALLSIPLLGPPGDALQPSPVIPHASGGEPRACYIFDPLSPFLQHRHRISAHTLLLS